MSQYFIDKLVYNKDTLDIHDTGAREMIANNTTNIQAVSARVTKNANDIDALEEITTDLREDVDNLDDRMGVAETEIDGLKTRTTNLEGRMNTAENRLDGHDTKISDLEDRMDTAENNIIALDGRMTAAENDIDAAEHRLDLVEAKNDEQDIAIDDLEENVAKNTADIVDIKDDLTGVHEDIEDLDDRITASTYEAGIGIYFGQGVEHTNINVEDEILDQINQNTIDIQNLKTRVTNVENRLTTVEGDIVNIKGDITDIKTEITSIKADITSIKADITALDARVTALEQKALPAGGRVKQVLMKNSATDFDVSWEDIRIPEYSWSGSDTFELPPETQFFGSMNNITNNNFWYSTGIGDLVPTSLLRVTGLQTDDEVVFLKTEHFSVCWINYQGGITLHLENKGGTWNLVSIDGISAGEVVVDANGLTYTQPNDRMIAIIRSLASILSLTGNSPDLKAILHVTYDDGTDGYITMNNSHKWNAIQGDFYYFTGMITKSDLSTTYVCKIEISGTFSPYTVTFSSASL